MITKLNVHIVVLLFTFASAFIIDEDKKDFVRFSDEGLYRATLNAFDNEWDATFVKGKPKKKILTTESVFIDRSFKFSGYEKQPRVMKSNSPVNFWFKCVDMKIRGYFFIESLAQHATPNFNGEIYFISVLLSEFSIIVKIWFMGPI